MKSPATTGRTTHTKPAIKQTCQDCHKEQADVVAQTDTHKKMDCIDCHMPFTMSCENFTAIQRPDMAGFDAVRRSHVFNIKVDPTAKMMNPARRSVPRLQLQGLAHCQGRGRPRLPRPYVVLRPYGQR